MGDHPYWELGNLSGKWLTICDQHLELHGASFNAPWSGNLSHIETKFTSASGIALVTFSVQGRSAASVVVAGGLDPAAESDAMKIFVDSLRKVALVKEAASSHAFQKVFTINERPVMIVVPWPDSAISDQDHEIIQELSIHTAGAFFRRSQRSN